MTGWASVWELALSALGWVGVNAANARPVRQGFEAEPPRVVEGSVRARAVNPIDEIAESLKAEGVAAADASGSGRPQVGAQTRLKRRAAVRVGALHRGTFDPERFGDDAVLQDRLDAGKRAVSRREETVERLKVQASRDQAAVVALEPRPGPPQLSIVTGIVGFAVGIAASLAVLPGFADIAEDDPVLALLVTGTIGLVFGTAAVAAQFDLYPLGARDAPTRSDTSRVSTWPVLAGVVMILSFGLVRGSAALSAETTTILFQEVLITLALMGLDLCVLGYVKAASIRYLSRMDAWVAKHADRPQRVKAHQDVLALLATAETDLANDRIALAAAEKDRAARELLNFDKELVSAWAADEAVSAYLQRVDEIAARQELGR